MVEGKLGPISINKVSVIQADNFYVTLLKARSVYEKETAKKSHSLLQLLAMEEQGSQSQIEYDTSPQINSLSMPFKYRQRAERYF